MYYVITGDYEHCYMYLERSFNAIEDRFGKNSLEVAYELDKISDVMVNNLDIRKNRYLICVNISIYLYLRTYILYIVYVHFNLNTNFNAVVD